MNTPLPEEIEEPIAIGPSGLRRVPRIAPGSAATALFGAMARDGDTLSALLEEVSGLVGCTAAAIWRRDDRGRLLLVRKHGDEALAAVGSQAGPLADEDASDGAFGGIPLELSSASGDVALLRLFGRPFASLPIADGVLVLGPLQRDRLASRERGRLRDLTTMVDGAIREVLRTAALESELDGLRREIELARRAVGSTIDAERSLQLLVDLAVTSSASRGGFIAVRRDDGFAIVATRDLPPAVEQLDVTPGRGILASVPGIPGLLVVEDPDRLSAVGVGGLLAVSGPEDAEDPMFIFGLVPDDAGELPLDCSTFLQTLIEQAALVLESSDAARATADRHVRALRGLCQALDARSPTTYGHHRLVADTARNLARRLGIDAQLARLVEDAALVHDAGLLATTRDAPLAAEFAHPALGAEMAALVPGAAELAPLIRAHHEWWDGFGFPSGLAGESIPLGARILAAAECYAEMCQPGNELEPARIVEEIRARRGTQLDPICADSVVALVEEDR